MTPRLPVRWVIAILLLLLSMLNYIDRQALSILAVSIQQELNLTDRDYARVGQAFLLCYTLSYLGAGRIVDAFGPRAAETFFVSFWSLANMLTAFASGFFSLAGVRGLLGLGESGHYAVAAKAVGQWFPPSEKGIAAGMYTMGGTLGAAVAAPLVAWLALQHGWRSVFVITGVAGFLLVALWWIVYRSPHEHPWISAQEVERLKSAGLLENASRKSVSHTLREIVRWKPIWLIIAARMLTDPVWYFYLVWFAKYLQEKCGMSLADVGASAWVIFVAADFGCLGSGLISGWLIRKGLTPVQARLRVIAGCASILVFGFLLALTKDTTATLILASVFAGCTMMFMTSCVTLPLDIFPARSLGSIQGLIGMGGSIGGFFSTGLIGTVLTQYQSYDSIFVVMSFVHPLAALLLWLCLPRFLKTFEPEKT